MSAFNLALDIENVLDIAEPLQLPVESSEGGFYVYGKVGALKRFLDQFASLVSDEVGISYRDAHNALVDACEAEVDPAGGDTVRYFWAGISVA